METIIISLVLFAVLFIIGKALNITGYKNLDQDQRNKVLETISRLKLVIYIPIITIAVIGIVLTKTVPIYNTIISFYYSILVILYFIVVNLYIVRKITFISTPNKYIKMLIISRTLQLVGLAILALGV